MISRVHEDFAQSLIFEEATWLESFYYSNFFFVDKAHGWSYCFGRYQRKREKPDRLNNKYMLRRKGYIAQTTRTSIRKDDINGEKM